MLQRKELSFFTFGEGITLLRKGYCNAIFFQNEKTCGGYNIANTLVQKTYIV